MDCLKRLRYPFNNLFNCLPWVSVTFFNTVLVVEVEELQNIFRKK